MPRAYRPTINGGAGTYDEHIYAGGTYDTDDNFDIFAGSSILLKVYWGTSTTGTKQFGSCYFPEGFPVSGLGSFGTYFGGNSSPGEVHSCLDFLG